MTRRQLTIWGPLRRLSMMTVILCLLPLPSDTQWWSIANLHDPRLRGRPGALRQTASGWYPDLTATTCFRIWCSGVVASNLATCPNSMWRLLIIVSVMFGRPVWAATSALSSFFNIHFIIALIIIMWVCYSILAKLWCWVSLERTSCLPLYTTIYAATSILARQRLTSTV